MTVTDPGRLPVNIVIAPTVKYYHFHEATEVGALTLPLAIPKEHGSWVMFFAALITGAGVAGQVTAPLILYLVSALAVFVIRKPLQMLLRGEAWTPEQKRRQVSQLVLLVTVATVTGLPLILVYRLSLFLPLAVLAGMLLSVDLFRSVLTPRTTVWSELAGVTGLALSGAGSYYAAAGSLDRAALSVFVVTALHFYSGVFNVRMHLKRLRRPPVDWASRWETAWPNLLSGPVSIGIATGLATRGLVPSLLWAALLPAALRSLRDSLLGERETNFKRLGWLETAYTILMVAILIASVRA